MTKKVFFLIFSFFLFGSMVMGVKAETNEDELSSEDQSRYEFRRELRSSQRESEVENEREQEAEQNRESMMQQTRAQLREQQCQLVQQRFETRIQRYENAREAHIKRYRLNYEALNRLVERLIAAGVDTSNLEASMMVLEQKIDKFEKDMDGYIDDLSVLKSNACEGELAQYANQLGDARSFLQILKADVTDIRSYLESTIRPELQSLKSQVKTN